MKKNTIDSKTMQALKKTAMQGAKNAYSPYSKIKVGAAVLTESGEIIGAGNVENMSYGGTICAERATFCKAVSEGHLKFKAVYLYTKEQWTPCGICRQFMSEWLSPETPVVLGSKTKETIVKFGDLLPQPIDLITFKKLQK